MIRWQMKLMFCLVVSAVNAAEIPKEFSARQITTIGDLSLPGNIHVSSGRIRFETSVHGVPEIVIMKPSKEHACVLMPTQKEYMRLPPRELELVLASVFGSKASYTQDSPEKEAGQATDKYRIDSPVGLLYLWIDSSTGKPLRLESVNKQIRLEWRQVKMAPQADALFERPADYRNFMAPDSAPAPKQNNNQSHSSAPDDERVYA